MATSLNRLVASHVFPNHRLLKMVLVTVSCCALQNGLLSVVIEKYIIRPICVLIGGNCRQKSTLQFPFTKTHIGLFFFVATEDGRFATRSNLTVMQTPFETRWL